MTETLLQATGLVKTFGKRQSAGHVRAVDEVDLVVPAGQIVGIMGETGSGKSTTARCLVGLETVDAGSLTYDGQDILHATGSARAKFRREVQMVFQNPYASLNPRMTVEQLVGEGLLVHGIVTDRTARRRRVREILDQVGLAGVDLRRLPRSFSGGQRQRIAIARALAVGPRLLICDEPVSALDVSVQAQIVNLLSDMRAELGLAVLFIAHDPAVLRHLCDQMVVMQDGRVVETGPTAEVFEHPRHSYTQQLLAAVPVADPAESRRRRAAAKAAAGPDEKGDRSC